MRAAAIVLLAASLLSGCAAIPLATGLALGTAAIGAGGLLLSGIHDCKQDGGCKAWKLPK